LNLKEQSARLSSSQDQRLVDGRSSQSKRATSFQNWASVIPSLAKPPNAQDQLPGWLKGT
jgi:hypothetical protein